MPDAQMIGPYRLERVLGTGSFATVWLAFDDVLDRQVAVKILADNWSRDHDVRRRFLAEARVLLTVESPRIVRAFHIGESPTGQPYLVMAYADRGTLGDRMDERRLQGRTFDARETVGIATEVAYALVDVHASGHLHRDVKPTNVLIRSSSTRRHIAGLAPDETVVLADFGLARGLDLSALTMVAGSPGYVAPEQAAGLTQLDRRADLYPLGRMMLEMLTGNPGGRATTMAGAASEQVDVAAVIGATTSEPTEEADRALVDLITRLVAKDPDRRPSSAEEVAAELLGIVAVTTSRGPGSGTAVLQPPSGPPMAMPVPSDGAAVATGTQLSARPPRQPSNGRIRVAVAGAGVLAVGAVVAIVVALAGGGGGGEGSSTTAEPVRPPDTTSAAGAPATDGTAVGTAPSGPPVSTVPATDVASPTGDPSVTSASGTSGGPARLLLPVGAFSPDQLTTAAPDPDRQEGAILLDAEQFAAALVAANPAWTGDPPAPAEDGRLDFEMTNAGRTAAVRIEPAGESTGAVIVSFVIEYS